MCSPVLAYGAELALCDEFAEAPADWETGVDAAGFPYFQQAGVVPTTATTNITNFFVACLDQRGKPSRLSSSIYPFERRNRGIAEPSRSIERRTQSSTRYSVDGYRRRQALPVAARQTTEII